MKFEGLHDILTDELKDIYSVEQQLIKQLPKFAKAADGDLRVAFEDHLLQTRNHASRIEQICDELKISPDGHKCLGIEGILKEGDQAMKAKVNPESVNAVLIGAAQRAEHYEIAAYGTARTHARQLGFTNMAAILDQTLNEEKATDQRLTLLAVTRENVRASMEHGSSSMGVSSGMQM